MMRKAVGAIGPSPRLEPGNVPALEPIAFGEEGEHSSGPHEAGRWHGVYLRPVGYSRLQINPTGRLADTTAVKC